MAAAWMKFKLKGQRPPQLKTVAIAPRYMDWLGRVAAKAVTDRTRRGVDFQGKPFPPYSKRYAREAKGGAQQPVTLTQTGGLLNRFTPIKKGPGRVEIGWYSTSDKKRASWLHLGTISKKTGKQMIPPRRFVAFDNKLRIKLITMAGKIVLEHGLIWRT